MDCWIGVIQEGDQCVVHVAGRLSVAEVPELLETCAASAPLDVDLTDLVSADAAGIEALRRLRAGGTTIVGAAGYIQLRLDSVTGPPAEPLPQPGPKA